VRIKEAKPRQRNPSKEKASTSQRNPPDNKPPALALRRQLRVQQLRHRQCLH
jgi:hypothetical protein